MGRKKSWFEKLECSGGNVLNIANSEDAAPTPSTNKAQRREKRRKQTNGETTAAPEGKINTSITQSDRKRHR